MIKNCFKRKTDEKEKSQSSGDLATVSTNVDTAKVLVITSKYSDNVWILDSGCSLHVSKLRIIS